MRIFFIIVLNVFIAFSICAHEVTLKVNLSPAGSFEAKSSKLKGDIKKNDKKLTADRLWLKIEDMKTGIDLRDEHFYKYLNSEKFPKIILSDVKAENGKGEGILNVNEIKKLVNFVYKMISEKKIEAKFKVKASDFKLKEARYLEIGVDDEVEVVAILDV